MSTYLCAFRRHSPVHVDFANKHCFISSGFGAAVLMARLLNFYNCGNWSNCFGSFYTRISKLKAFHCPPSLRQFQYMSHSYDVRGKIPEINCISSPKPGAIQVGVPRIRIKRVASNQDSLPTVIRVPSQRKRRGKSIRRQYIEGVGYIHIRNRNETEANANEQRHTRTYFPSSHRPTLLRIQLHHRILGREIKAPNEIKRKPSQKAKLRKRIEPGRK